MWHFSSSPALTLSDTDAFLNTLRTHAQFFDPQQPVSVARAPGRLDLMGGIADYSGALVLELPLACATWAAVQWAEANTVTVYSLNAKEIQSVSEVTHPLAGVLTDYATAQARLTTDPARRWAAYVAGTLTVLHQERGFSFPVGLKFFITSDVPVGKGVSSSAAMEVASMLAVCGLLGMTLEGREVAVLCQKVENLVVGAPCGIMDQMTSACGVGGSLTALLCQPAELQSAVPLPAELEVWGIDSGIRHAVSGADYGSVRVGAFMGYRMIAELAGWPMDPLGKGRVTVADPVWGGYLANITPSLWETHYRAQIPATITGADFLARYGGFTDAVTHIEPGRVYAVRQPTAHPIYEHHRVRHFRALLQQATLTDEHCRLLGELMFQSHWSYSACGLGAEGTDDLVNLVRAAGPESGLYGAKITGGGSGGTVAVLARAGSLPRIQHLAEEYAQRSGRAALVLGGSSPGAVAFGAHRLHWAA
jgi:L-arabinokinase